MRCNGNEHFCPIVSTQNGYIAILEYKYQYVTMTVPKTATYTGGETPGVVWHQPLQTFLSFTSMCEFTLKGCIQLSCWISSLFIITRHFNSHFFNDNNSLSNYRKNSSWQQFGGAAQVTRSVGWLKSDRRAPLNNWFAWGMGLYRDHFF